MPTCHAAEHLILVPVILSEGERGKQACVSDSIITFFFGEFSATRNDFLDTSWRGEFHHDA